MGNWICNKCGGKENKNHETDSDIFSAEVSTDNENPKKENPDTPKRQNRVLRSRHIQEDDKV